MDNIINNILCCCKKKDKEVKKPLLENTIYCPYCKKTYIFNEYYIHFYNCKRENIESIDIHGDL